MAAIRTGVVGVGHLGYHHARLYAALPGAELAGVVDTDEARRVRAAEEFTVPGFSDVRGLLELGVDAVSVATPTTAHHDVAIDLLCNGVHVLVEKPIAATVFEAETMAAVARAHHRVLQVGHVERFNGAVLALFNAIKRPRFIECHRLSPYPKRSTDISVVLDLMIHDLDIVLALAGTEATLLDAVGVPVFSEEEDIANVRLRFASGCVANLTSSRVSVEPMRKIRIFEENAYVSTSYSDQEVLVYRRTPEPLPPGANPMEHISIEPLPVQREEPLRLELASFLECVRGNNRPVVSAEDGIRALKLAHEILECIRKQRT
ncbi:MAG: Gfo/Idh/MocA family oxidoreductase [Candidatus Hydrogenedentes bacterium]|nr:Gfo/Idh/MocA family oxidoreductase [Candidatus Hydrogenedentota bacterium]